MIYGQITGIDKPISRLVQGTMMVTSENIDGGFGFLDAVLELGCNAFDTAHVYGQGDNERVLGRWIRERNNRIRVVIITKGAHHNEDRKRVTPFDITSDLHDSLARLKVDTIDLYLLHRDDLAVPVGPIVEILNDHVQNGLIRAFGASNWTHQRIHEANKYAEANDLIPFPASSSQLSLAEQVQEPWPGCVSISGPQGQPAREWYESTGMPLLTWSSLAGGFFSGRFTRRNLDSFDDYLDTLCVSSYCYEANFERLDRARQLANEMGLTLPQVALAYVLNQPLNIFAIVGCRNVAEFRSNAEAAPIDLSPKDIAWLTLASETRG